MYVVIDIDKEVYDHILKAESIPDLLGIDIVNVVNAVKNGKLISMTLTVSQAFTILLQTLNVELDGEPPKFEVEDGEIVCDYDQRGELYLALYHLATKIFPNTEFRHLFNNPNTLMNNLYIAKESGVT